jgi:acyl carrier protein
MMDRDTLLATLVSLLEEEMGERFPDLEETTDLREGLGLDSVDVVGLVMRVEHQFRIRLAMEELMEVKRVEHLLDLVTAKLGAKEERTLAAMSDLQTSAA